MAPGAYVTISVPENTMRATQEVALPEHLTPHSRLIADLLFAGGRKVVGNPFFTNLTRSASEVIWKIQTFWTMHYSSRGHQMSTTQIWRARD
jgi:hypothetical protein